MSPTSRASLAALAFTVVGVRANDADADYAVKLVRPRFDRLIPTSYPLVQTGFSKLKPTSYPVINPGAPLVHPGEKLVRPMDSPLLQTIRISSK